MSKSVEEFLEQIEMLVTGRDNPRDFDVAHHVARMMLLEHSSDPRTWTQLVLLDNLTGRHDQAIESQKRAVTCCKEAWTSIYNGDCERDHTLFHVRRREFRLAHEHLIAARQDHAEDPNRLIALLMVEGRWWYAQRRYVEALWYFSLAAELWGELDSCNGEVQADPQWRFNNDVWIFKTLAARREPKASLRIYMASLEERMPQHGSPDIALRLKLIMRFGRLGNWLDDAAQSPQVQHLITHPRVKRLAKRVLARE